MLFVWFLFCFFVWIIFKVQLQKTQFSVICKENTFHHKSWLYYYKKKVGGGGGGGGLHIKGIFFLIFNQNIFTDLSYLCYG